MERRSPRRWLLALACLPLVWACEDCVYVSRNNTEAAIRFYVFRPTTPTRNGLAPIRTGAVDTILTLAANRRTFRILPNEADDPARPAGYANAGIPAGAFFLPMDPARDTSSFVLIRRVGSPARRRVDTLTIAHDRTLSVITPNCGYDQRLDNVRVVRHTFDSVALFNTSFSISDSVNLRIFVR